MEWFATKAGTSYKNKADYSSIINRYILPALGEVKISEIKTHQRTARKDAFQDAP
ncbi:MAG: hypothetical protein LBC41_09180 [Clostridiales bacterium]|jgi:hypothetical protein|nr:hypothetical protein [Clostridiales bacterium]